MKLTYYTVIIWADELWRNCCILEQPEPKDTFSENLVIRRINAQAHKITHRNTRTHTHTDLRFLPSDLERTKLGGVLLLLQLE